MCSPRVKALSALLLFFVASTSFAQDLTPPPEANQQKSLPYEVIVTPLIRKRDLRALISQVQKDYVERFNELNMDNDYDISCYRYRPTGSHIERETCEPIFLIKARGDDASRATDELARARNLAQFEAVIVRSPDEIRREVKGDFEVLQTKIEELTGSDQVLQSIAASLNELTERLQNYGED